MNLYWRRHIIGRGERETGANQERQALGVQAAFKVQVSP